MSAANVSHGFRGFTLVELLIVVVILGILAAIVVPQFTSASDASRESTTRALLHTLRVQIELYKTQHNGQQPTLAQLWGNLTDRTDSDGNFDPDGRFGPYLTKEPTNQYTQSETIVAAGMGTANDGWEYDEATGSITAVGFDEETGDYNPPVP